MSRTFIEEEISDSDLSESSCDSLIRNESDIISVGEYTLLHDQLLGRGTFSDVYKGYHSKTGKDVAIKKIDLSRVKRLKDKLQKEIDITKDLKHPNVIELYTAIRTGTTIYLVLELCECDLSQKLKKKPISEKKAKGYFQQITNGLKYLRSKNIIHRDLKPQNILIKDGVLKITDFGFSTIQEENALVSTICGSPLYMCPTVFLGQGYTDKADIWSLGVILYLMIYGKHPFNAKNHPELIKKVLKTEIEYPPEIEISMECKELIKGLLKKDPDERLNWVELFEHPFLKDPPSINILDNYAPSISSPFGSPVTPFSVSSGSNGASNVVKSNWRDYITDTKDLLVYSFHSLRSV